MPLHQIFNRTTFQNPHNPLLNLQKIIIRLILPISIFEHLAYNLPNLDVQQKSFQKRIYSKNFILNP
jgi:hypothetical protein